MMEGNFSIAELLNDLCRSVFFSEFLNKYEFVRRIVVERVMNQTLVGKIHHFFLSEGLL
jgi:hypothetical protein